MKKRTVAELIQSHYERNESIFRKATLEIIEEFESIGDKELAVFLRAQINPNVAITPQSLNLFSDEKIDSPYFTEISTVTENLVIPKPVLNDLQGITNAIAKGRGVNKFLFYGPPGTGKTECSKKVANLLKRRLYILNVPYLIDSKLGQTSKNIMDTFDLIKKFSDLDRTIFLFDELDALALTRTDANDLREMSRVTSTLLRCLDELPKEAVIISTTNLALRLDEALRRRFDYQVSFDSYTEEDLLLVAKDLYDRFAKDYPDQKKNPTVYEKLIRAYCKGYSPAQLHNIVRTAMAFSSESDPTEHLRRIFKSICPNFSNNYIQLYDFGLTLRDIELITGKSKSQIWRNIKEGSNE